MYISRLQIQNFRNYKSLDIPFSPGVNSLVGENGIGKTNLLYAIRLVLDSELSAANRRLDEDDFYLRCGPPMATQILISLHFSNFKGEIAAEAAVGKWLDMETNVAKLTYRFRPKAPVRQSIENGERDNSSLTIADYGFERVGGLERYNKTSLLESTWSDEIGTRVVDSDIQNFHFVELPALRDAVRDLRQVRQSPLWRLLQTVDLSEADATAIEQAMQAVNKLVRETKAIAGLGEAIDKSYGDLTRGLSILRVQLGLSEATISSILRNLSLLLSDEYLTEFEMSRNGLGFNNLLYAAIQVQYFKNRATKGSFGQLLVIEEPEAHLHPHAQRNLIHTLSAQNFQIILSSHSPELCSQIGLEKVIALGRSAREGTTGSNLVETAKLGPHEISDLNRYLDATRASLLFARRTILVEGPAELYLVRAFAELLQVDLSGEGISLISVNGTHFDPFVKLFGTGLLGHKCAVIRDGDEHSRNGSIRALFDDGTTSSSTVGEWVSTFANKTTLEFAVLNPETAPRIASLAANLNARTLKRMLDKIVGGETSADVFAKAQLQLLRLAVRSGKARFAQQLAPLLVGLGESSVPGYIRDAIAWVRK